MRVGKDMSQNITQERYVNTKIPIEYDYVAFYKVFRGSHSEHKTLELDSLNKHDAEKESLILEILHNTAKFSAEELQECNKERLNQIAKKHKEDNCEHWIYDLNGIAKRAIVRICLNCEMVVDTLAKKCSVCNSPITILRQYE